MRIKQPHGFGSIPRQTPFGLYAVRNVIGGFWTKNTPKGVICGFGLVGLVTYSLSKTFFMCNNLS